MLALSECEYTVKNSKWFVEKVKTEKNPSNFKIMSFSVKSLFTNVPYDRTVRIYNRTEISTEISLPQMKTLLYFCNNNLNFSFITRIYIQNVGVATRSPLDSVLVNISMVELERSAIPCLSSRFKNWRVKLTGQFVLWKLTGLNMFY